VFSIEWAPDALADVERIRPFDARPIFAALAEIRHQADVETRNRKPLREPLEELPDASWEVRVGEFRVFYRISGEALGAEQVGVGKTARILRVIFKGRSTTAEALRRGRAP
jgi:hypothetical protein